MLNQEQQIFEQIKKANNILITFGQNWEGDAVAGALACFLFLQKMGKNVGIAADKNNGTDLFSFLPAYGQISRKLENARKFIIALDTTQARVDKVKYTTEDNAVKFIISTKEGFFSPDNVRTYPGDFKFDLIISIDTTDLETLGLIYEKNAEFFYQVPIINIDHHAENESYGQINAVELTAVATTEVLFNLFANYSRDLIDEDIATCLLTGIISKTRSFKTQYMTPGALSTAAQLISMGARREDIVNRLYRSRSINVLKLWGRVLARLSSGLDGKLVWSIISRSDFAKTGAIESDLSEVIDELIINVPQAKIIIIIYETETASAMPGAANIVTKAIIYTVSNLNALDLVKEYHPMGTKNLAKVIIPKELAIAEKELSETIQNNLTKIPL